MTLRLATLMVCAILLRVSLEITASHRTMICCMPGGIQRGVVTQVREVKVQGLKYQQIVLQHENNDTSVTIPWVLSPDCVPYMLLLEQYNDAMQKEWRVGDQVRVRFGVEGSNELDEYHEVSRCQGSAPQ